MRGRFITFEGPDGSGKSTQIRLLSEYLEDRGQQVLITREPGGCQIAESIREMILEVEHDEMTAVTEALLFAAARAQHVAEIIRPALDDGINVICDRFLDSSLAYQGYGRGLGIDMVEAINQYGLDGLRPDVTFLFEIHWQKAQARLAGRCMPDRMEGQDDDFQLRVWQGFGKLADDAQQRIVRINVDQEIDVVYNTILQEMRAHGLIDGA